MGSLMSNNIVTTVTTFDHQRGGDFPGNRGVVVRTERPYASGLVFSIDLPAVYISDAGDVEFGEYRMPAEDFIAWASAVTAQIRAHQSALDPAALAEDVAS